MEFKPMPVVIFSAEKRIPKDNLLSLPLLECNFRIAHKFEVVILSD